MNKKNRNLIDLHIHTDYSDGENSILETLKLIEKNNVQTFAITDHDNIKSCEDLSHIILNNLDYINGVEMSSKLGKYNMHILGYNFNHKSIELNSLLSRINKLRKERIIELIGYLYNVYKIKFNEKDITELLDKSSSIGKAHIINLLYKYGYGINNKEIYLKYLKGWISKVKYRATLDESTSIMKLAGGITILAHPKEIENEYNIDITSIIEEIITNGVQGIEVYNSLHNLDDVKRYLKIAEQYNLLISGGSDFHGQFVKPNVCIGEVTKEKDNIKTLSLVNHIKNNERKRTI